MTRHDSHSSTNVRLARMGWLLSLALFVVISAGAQEPDKRHVTPVKPETNRVQPCELSAGVLWICLKKDLTEGRGVLLLSNGDGYNEEPDWTNDIRGNGNVTGASTLARLDFLTTQTTLYIGSTEGQHRSRAKYLYIRVVRKH